SFRQGLDAFDTVTIFCHPHPGNAGMRDEDYLGRTGEWPKLFRYAEIFGRQMDIAQSNHITIIPFFSNASYCDTGIFGRNWKDFFEQILARVRNAARTPQPPATKARAAVTPIESIEYSSVSRKKGAPPPVVDMSGRLQHVVLSDFSHGRQLMWTVRRQLPG